MNPAFSPLWSDLRSSRLNPYDGDIGIIDFVAAAVTDAFV